MSEAQKQKAIKANLFGQGFEDGHRSTIGCSYKGRIWSYRTANLLTLTTWCRSVGAKLLDEQLDPEEVLRGTLVPVLVSERPQKMPVAVEWLPIFYREQEQLFSFQINGTTVYREEHDADIVLDDPSENGPLAFSVSGESGTATFELDLNTSDGNPDFSIQARGNVNAILNYRCRSMSLKEFFEQEPPHILVCRRLVTCRNRIRRSEEAACAFPKGPDSALGLDRYEDPHGIAGHRRGTPSQSSIELSPS